jgi:hypothetical protein
MNKLQFIVPLLILSLTLSAQTRSMEDALIIANRLSCNKSDNADYGAKGVSPAKLKHAYTCKKQGTVNYEDIYYYVFNKADNGGYIIVSGDERVLPVLGYSDRGQFNEDSLPPQLSDWLKYYQFEMDNISAATPMNSANSENYFQKAKFMSTATSVSPLLGEIGWSQSSPFNNYCPFISSIGSKASAGCVATAMAQVMKYYQWPARGNGSNSYQTRTYGLTISEDFSNTTYDWANMQNTYSSSSSAEQNNAVATLLYHCGAAVNMDYSSLSGASTYDVTKALINYFNYDPNIQHLLRDYYTRAEWIDILKNEINQGRPVLYSGDSQSTGHFFVCDGYDENNYFHFNWGWGGNYDGYFPVSILNPTDPQLGSNTVGYNMAQEVIIGIQKPGSVSASTHSIYTAAGLSVSSSNVPRSGSVSVKAKSVYNYGANSFTGDIGIGLYNDYGLVTVLNTMLVSAVNPLYGWSEFSLSAVNIPTSVSNGKYKIYPVYQANDENQWHIIRGKTGTATNYIEVSVKSDMISYSAPLNEMPALNVNEINITGNIYESKKGRVTVSVTNRGKEYNSFLGIYLISTTDITNHQLVSNVPVNIANNETVTINFSDVINVKSGAYYLKVIYDPANNMDVFRQTNGFSDLSVSASPINVQPVPTSPANLTLTSNISFVEPLSLTNNNAKLSVSLKNEGGYYEGKLMAVLFRSSGGSVGNFGNQTQIVDENETANVLLEETLDLTPDSYKVLLYYYENKTWKLLTPNSYSTLTFTLDKPISTNVNSLSATDEIRVYPNPAINQLTIATSSPADHVAIYSVDGALLRSVNMNNTPDACNIDVSTLSKGNYIVQVKTAEGLKQAKFVKQ